MDLDKLLRKNPNLRVASEEEAKEFLDAKPDFGLNSSLYIGCEIYQILSSRIVHPKIEGVTRGATTLMQCSTNWYGSKVERPIFLSSLTRKLDTNREYRGVIARHEAFKNCRSFSESDWVTAFKKVCPLKIVSRTEGHMDIKDKDGLTLSVPIFELELEQC